MTKFYSITDPIKYDGPDSKNALAYRWYNPTEVLGKSWRSICALRVLLATMCWPGTDPLAARLHPPMHHMRPHGSGGDESRYDV